MLPGNGIGWAPIFLLTAGLWVNASASEERETQARQEITQLIELVATSSCIFIRNDREYQSGPAADHLRLKWRRGKKYAATAEKFIDNLASKSSWTGKRYQMQCPGEDIQYTGNWLHERLHDIRN